MSTFCNQTIPILRIFDVNKAREFYVDWLGFTVDWEHRFEDDAPLYMQVTRDGLTLHLSEHHGDCSPGARVFIRTEMAVELHQELSAKEYRYNNPGIGPTPWNSMCIEVIDPFGNRLTFDQSMD